MHAGRNILSPGVAQNLPSPVISTEGPNREIEIANYLHLVQGLMGMEGLLIFLQKPAGLGILLTDSVQILFSS